MKTRLICILMAFCAMALSCKKENKGSGNGPGKEEKYVKVPLQKVAYWTIVKSEMLHSGLRLTEYSCDTTDQRIWLATVDLHEPTLEFTCGLSQDIIPNPGGSSSYHPSLRENLSDICKRRTEAGERILVGINADYFDTKNGIVWGPHVEKGELLFIGNPRAQTRDDVRRRGFTVYADRTVDCGSLRTFTGKLEVDGRQYSISSVNDTTLRHASWPINLYSSRYVRVPHPEAETLVNELYPWALYVRFRYTGDPMRVNAGWTDAVVTGIYDGREIDNPEPPYLTDAGEWAMQITGATATELAGKLSVGSAMRLRADMMIEGRTPNRMETHVSGAVQYLRSGEINTTWEELRNPMTWLACDQSRRKVYVFVADGRKKGWSLGVNRWDLTRFAWQLGCWDLNILDGGGSTAMWVSHDGEGALVNRPCDYQGERSDLNYLFVKLKD